MAMYFNDQGYFCLIKNVSNCGGWGRREGFLPKSGENPHSLVPFIWIKIFSHQKGKWLKSNKIIMNGVHHARVKNRKTPSSSAILKPSEIWPIFKYKTCLVLLFVKTYNINI